MASFSQGNSNDDDPCNGLLQLALRMFSLNTAQQCTTLFTILRKILNNVLTAPDDVKYRTIKLSNKIIDAKIVNIHGGLEFLRSMKFHRATLQREQLLIMHDEQLDVSWLEVGLATLDSVDLSTPNTSSTSSSSASAGTVLAECILHIVLPTGHTLRAGFANNESIKDVYTFVDYARTDGKRNQGMDSFTLCTSYPQQELVGAWHSKTLQEAGLTPRSKLIIKKQKRPDAPDAFQDKPEDKEARERQQRLEREQRELQEQLVVQNKKKEKAAIKLERERALQSFKDDRTDVVRRVEFESMRDARLHHEAGWRQRMGQEVVNVEGTKQANDGSDAAK